MNNIKPIKKQNLADDVYTQMLNKIISGEWPQDTMIPSENDLREAFNVSRETVRQAVHRLNALGILKSYQGKGTYVERIDTGFYLNLLAPAVFLNEGDSISILEFMKCIQVESVRIVCRRASDDEIEMLNTYLQKMKTATDYDNYFSLDMEYHCYLVQLTKNTLFIKSMEIIERLLHIYLRDIVAFHGSNLSIEQHDDCYKAIRERNIDKAVHIMVEHYDMLMQRMHEWLGKTENKGM